MFDRFRKEDPALTEAIDSGFTDLKGYTFETPEAEKIIARLTELNKLRKKKFDPDQLAVIGSNLGIAAMLIMFEKHHVITTKVPQFLSKLR